MHDPWRHLNAFTEARIAQGRVGAALPTEAVLAFQRSHALARDAVLKPWAFRELIQQLEAEEILLVTLETSATDRTQYLQRPDLGRRLSGKSLNFLADRNAAPVDLALMITNGLSSSAIEAHGLPLAKALISKALQQGLSIGEVVIVPNARVALSDQVGAMLRARSVLIMVGERPGLSADDSVGLYLTYGPSLGRTDADRNCISNIRPPAGLGYEEAAFKALHLLSKALSLGYSGVQLKDESPQDLRLQNGSDCRVLEDHVFSEVQE
jgi:ethanolamine ammonia-lyase small subunit